MTDIALLFARLILGLGMAAHGAQKLLGWFGGHGLAGTAAFFDQMGFRPGKLFAFMASASEVGSGVLIALGLLGPVGPALLISVMVVAGVSVHAKNGFFAMRNGYELAVLYAVAALVLAFTGPGQWSLDAVVGPKGFWSPGRNALIIGIGILGGLANLTLRRPATPASAS
jgi:putative oxidoreductase